MTDIIQLNDKNGNVVYPQTHKNAVVDFPAVDSAPTSGSANLVNSGGTYSAIQTAMNAVEQGATEIYDISANNSGASYATLSAALALVPSVLRKGGMSVKYIDSTTSKYVQYRLTASAWSNTESDWDSCVVDDEPSVGSGNLVKSGGVFGILKDVGIYKGMFTNGATIFTSDEVSAGSTISVELELTMQSGALQVVDANNTALKTFNVAGQSAGYKRVFDDYVLPDTYDKIIQLTGYGNSVIATIKIKEEIEEGEVTAAKLADAAVTTAKVEDSAITTAKVASKAITIDKTNLDLIPEEGDDFDYTGVIAELYMIAPISADTYISFKAKYGRIYIQSVTANGSNPSEYWIAITDYLTMYSDGDIIPIPCTTANESLGVAVGDIVGYVILRNKSKIITYVDNSRGCRITYTSRLYDKTFSPVIANSFAPVSSERIEKDFIKSVLVQNSVYDLRDCIEELYLEKDAVVYNDTDGYTGISIKVYSNALYVRSYNGTSTYGWQSVLSLASAVDSTVYELKVTTAGTNSQYAVGDTVGYVVFKDVTTLKTLTTGGTPNNGVRDNIIQLRLSPMCYAYALTKNIEVENVLQYADIQLPSDIYLVADNPLMIFYKNIVKSYNPDLYGIRVVSSVGKAYPRYYYLNTSTTGDYSVAFNIVDKDDNVISTTTTTIHVIAAMSAPSSNINVLVFGASTMADGKVTGELKRRLIEDTGDGTSQNPTGLDLGNITFVGRKTGTLVNVNQEATGGWSWQNYATEGQLAYRFYVTGVSQLNIGDTYTQNGVTLTITEINVTEGSGNIRCTYSGTNALSESGTLTRSSGSGDSTITYTSVESENYNPFWNPEKTGGAGLDFANYATQYCNGTIDVMVACCGLNDFNAYTAATMSNLFTDYIKPFIRAFKTDFPNGKFILSSLHLPSPNGGMAANYGASAKWNWLTTAHKVWAFASEAEKLCKESEFSSYVYLSDVTSEFDCENSYPTEQAYINNRSSVQESRDTNGLHFTESGAFQVSDSLYHTFNRL